MMSSGHTTATVHGAAALHRNFIRERTVFQPSGIYSNTRQGVWNPKWTVLVFIYAHRLQNPLVYIVQPILQDTAVGLYARRKCIEREHNIIKPKLPKSLGSGYIPIVTRRPQSSTIDFKIHFYYPFSTDITKIS